VGVAKKRDYRKADRNFQPHYKLLNRDRRMEYAVRFTMAGAKRKNE